jgi:thiamine biosynthesis lipoprotein
MRPDAGLTAHHFEALGTSCSVFGVGPARERLAEAEAWVRRMGSRLTRFSDRSELSRLNSSGGRWFEISGDLESLLRQSLHAFEMSAGLVNVAVLPSMIAIGYARSLSKGAPTGGLVSARPLPPLPDVLSLRRGAARLASGAGLDLGGVAKGWMADRLVAMLGPNSLANLGGDLMTAGAGPGGEGWPVSVAGVTLLLRDQGAATSSVRRRRWGDAHHLIDPRTGLPSRSGLEEVSVVACTGLEAEVIAKAALLAGRDAAPVYCAAHALAWWLSP